MRFTRVTLVARRPACVAALALLALVLTAPSAPADAGCSHYAAPPADGGDDVTGDGSQASPWASPFVLLARLDPGETGCLKDGATFNLGPGEAQSATTGTAAAPKILRPATPGARATIQATLGSAFLPASAYLVLRDLNLRRIRPADCETPAPVNPAACGGSLLQLDGDHLTLEGMDLTYPHNICADIGQDPRQGATNRSDGIVIRRSRIHTAAATTDPRVCPTTPACTASMRS